MITLAQLEALRRIAEQGQRTDNDVCVAASTLLALLDDLAALRERLTAAERVVRATRSYPNALMLDALEAYDALPVVSPVEPQPTRCPGCGMVHAPHDFGRCERCGIPLDNLTTGISIVADGSRICAACLRPDDDEIARVRGL